MLRRVIVFMNDERSLSATETSQALAGEAVLARVAVPAQRTKHPAVGDPQVLSHRDKRLIAIGMMLPVFLGSVDQSVLASALPTIGRDLGQVHNLPWLVTAFLIASTALTPLYGKFADVHGRRAAMLIGISIYMIGSLISAASTNMLMLIGGRVVQGCGAGGLVVTANMVLGDIAAPKERGRYYTYFSIAFMTAGGAGPALGGWISEHLRWLMIFLWNFPLCAVAVAIALTVLRRLPRRERQHRLDVVGAVFVIAASSSFMLALNLGGIRYPWLSPPIAALFVCALVLGAGFVLHLRTAIEPLVPIAILADPAARLAAHSFGWGAIINLNVFLPMYLQSALGWSPTSAGLSLVVLMVTLNSTAGLSSQLLGRVRRYKLLPLCFLCIGVGAVVALALSAEDMTSLRFEFILLLIGIGFGPTAPLTQVALQNTVPVHDLGAALGSMNFVRTLVATIMIAIFGAIVLANAPVGARAGTLSQSFLGGASVTAFGVVFLVIAATLAASFLSLFLLEEKPLADSYAR